MFYLLNVILPVLYLFLCILFFRYLKKKNIIVVHIHPYTGKKDHHIYFVYIQWCLFFLLVLASFFLFHPFVVSFISLLFFLFSYISLLKASKNPWGNIIKEWTYSEEEQKRWEEGFKNEKKSFFYRSFPSSNVIFTDSFLFLSKRRYFSIRMRKFNDHLELSHINVVGDFLVFTYSFQKSVPLRYVYVYIPKGKKKEANQLVSTFQKMLK